MRSWNFRLGVVAASLAMAAAPVLAGQKPSESGSPHESHAAAVDRPSPGASGGSYVNDDQCRLIANSWRLEFGPDAIFGRSVDALVQRRFPARVLLRGTATSHNGWRGRVGTRAAAAAAVKPVAAPTTVASTRCRAAAAQRAGRTTPAAQREAVERQPHGALRRPARTETSRTRIRIVPCRHGAGLEAIDPRPEWRCHGPAVPRTAVW